MRKTIKSALEVEGIPYTDTLMDDFDIAHFIYPIDDNELEEIIERKIPIVVSALYTEDDPSSSYIDYKNKDGIKTYSLKSKCLKFLEKANLILVPNEVAKNMLVDAGIKNRIEICSPGVNFSRFDFSRDDEKDIFYRYFSCNKDKKIVFAVGDCSSGLDGIGVVLNAARICEDVNFYYYAKSGKGLKIPHSTKKIIKKLPDNVFFYNFIPDDVYRSALLNADVYLHPGYKTAGIVSIFESMAAKCQLIVRKQNILSDIAIDQKSAYVASYTETLSSIIKDYFEGKIKPTIDEAYNWVCKYDIKYFGENLNKFYLDLLNEEI